jgi:hypothetical protein
MVVFPFVPVTPTILIFHLDYHRSWLQPVPLLPEHQLDLNIGNIINYFIRHNTAQNRNSASLNGCRYKVVTIGEQPLLATNKLPDATFRNQA